MVSDDPDSHWRRWTTEMKVAGQGTATRDESLMGLPRLEVAQCAHDTVFARILQLAVAARPYRYHKVSALFSLRQQAIGLLQKHVHHERCIAAVFKKEFQRSTVFKLALADDNVLRATHILQERFRCMRNQ